MGAMSRAVVGAAKRDGEFVAGFASERPRLDVSKMMRVRRLAAANEAWLLGHIAQMVPIAVTTRRSNREHTLIDSSGLTTRRRSFRVLPRHRIWRSGTLFPLRPRLQWAMRGGIVFARMPPRGAWHPLQ